LNLEGLGVILVPEFVSDKPWQSSDGLHVPFATAFSDNSFLMIW
jgi:hypothetical protein